MSLHHAGPHDLPADPPDAAFAVVAGGYVAVLLAIPLVLAGAALGLGAAALSLGYLGSLLAAGVVVGRAVTRTPGLAVRVGRSPFRWLLPAAAPLVFVAAFVAPGSVDIGVRIGLGMVSTVGLLLFGLPLAVMGGNRYTGAVLATTTERARFEARWPARWRRVGGVGVGIAVVVGGVSLAAQLLVAAERAWLGIVFINLMLPFTAMLQRRRVQVTDAGVVVGVPNYRRFHPWTRYDAVERSEGALVVRAAALWRVSLRFDPEDIEDVDAVVRTLRTCLNG